MFAKDGAVSGSSAMTFAKSAGEPPDQSAARSATSDFILGSASLTLIALLSLLTMSAGLRQQ
jgi:hypothetical protein